MKRQPYYFIVLGETINRGGRVYEHTQPCYSI